MADQEYYLIIKLKNWRILLSCIITLVFHQQAPTSNGFLEPNSFRNIDQLWDDIYQIDRDDTNQVMYDYLDKSFIKRAIGVNEPVVTI